MTRSARKVVVWRQRARARLVAAFGGRCGICGYDRCAAALSLHHVDPAAKSFSFGSFQSIAWAKLCAEARKCVLVCSNCHAEVHANLASVDACPRFDEAFADYKTKGL